MNITFKSVIKILNLFSSNNPNKVELCLEILGINVEDEYKNVVLDEIAKYIFDVTKQEKSKKKVFDLEQDYKYYFADFFKIGINLNKQEIDWWEFDSILESFMLDEKSTISQVIKYRTYEKPPKNHKVSENQEHKFYMKMKKNYALKSENNVNDSLERLWAYTEKKVGEQKEC